MSGSDPIKLSSHHRAPDNNCLGKRHGIMDKLELKQEPPEDEDDDCYAAAEERNRVQGPGATGIPGAIAVPHAARVRSHARSLRAMANPSAVWAHFDLCANDALRAQCRICGSVVVRGGANPRQCGTTNLHRHLRVHHGGRLIGRRYHVMQSGSQGSSAGRTIRIASQSLVRQPLRNIAPAPTSGQHYRQQQHQQQQQQQPKTLVLKTIPLKVKQVAPTTIKMAPRPPNMGIPQNILPQPSTEVCLRWNSYHSNMQNSFPSLLDTEQFVDVTLACEGRSLKCHKMILSSCSDYLAALLRENPCQHPIILMKDLKFWEVEALVKFMYRGEVNVAHDKLPQLLNAAEALQIKGLAGPSPSLQSQKPPKLVPQSKPLSHALPSAMSGGSPRVMTEPKESRNKGACLSSGTGMTTTTTSTTSSAATTTSAITTTSSSTSGLTVGASPKRVQKRQASEPPQPRIFTKIRLQRPVTPTSPNLTVKSEPLDIPLSPTDIFPDRHHHHLHHRRRQQHHHRHRRHSRDEDISSTASNFDNLVMALHDEDEDEDPDGGGGGAGGVGPDDDIGSPGVDEDEDEERCSDDGDINFRINLAARSNQDDHNENEEQMEFVPTDFLDQEQDIVEEAEFSKSSGDEDEEEEDDDDEGQEVEEDDDDGAEEVDDDLVEETIQTSREDRKNNHSDNHRIVNDKRAEQCTNSDKHLP